MHASAWQCRPNGLNVHFSTSAVFHPVNRLVSMHSFVPRLVWFGCCVISPAPWTVSTSYELVNQRKPIRFHGVDPTNVEVGPEEHTRYP